jgi:hypothetical protein
VIATAAAVQAAQAPTVAPRPARIVALEDPPAKKKPAAAAAKPLKPALGPREACGDRNFISMAFCMNSKCREGRFEKHPQCVALQRQYAERRQRDDHP